MGFVQGRNFKRDCPHAPASIGSPDKGRVGGVSWGAETENSDAMGIPQAGLFS